MVRQGTSSSSNPQGEQSFLRKSYISSRKTPTPTLSAHSQFNRRNLLIVIVLGAALFAQRAQQAIDSPVTQPALASPSIPDFSVTATPPNTVLADGVALSTSTIVVSSLDGFAGTVTLSDLPPPRGLTCTAIDPATIPNGSGMARVSCSSGVPNSYNVTITGTSDKIRHNATATFTFATSTSPDFNIAAVSSMRLTLGTTVTSNVTVTTQGGFDSQVNLTATVYPSTGLAVSLTPQLLAHGAGTATATFSALAAGDYTVTIAGMSKSLSHTTTTVLLVTLTAVPDFEISASPSSMYLQAGNPSITRIIVDADSGFTGLVALAVAAPSGILCSLNPTRLESSGTSTLTCNSSTAGEYVVAIKATAGASAKNTTVDVHVAALSRASPTPSTILGLAPAIVYGLIGAIVAVLVAGTVLVLKRSYRARQE